MKIIAGETTIDAVPILEGVTSYNGQPVESIRLQTSGCFTPEQIADLISNPWDEYDNDDVLVSRVEGFNTLHASSIVLLRVPDWVKEREALQAALLAKDAELQAALAQLSTT